MTDNAFEREERPLFDEDNLPMFEQVQRALPEDGVNDAVESVLRDMPPDDAQVAGIKKNVQDLEDSGLWATARFYKRLLEKREAQEG